MAEPPTVVAECDRPGEARVTVAAPTNQTDNYTVTPRVEARLGSQTGSVITFPRNFPMGSSTVHWSATDDWNLVGWTNPPQTIRVRDQTAPVATPGPALVIEAVSPSGTAYVPALQSVSDVCDASPTSDYSPRGPYPLGDTIVSFVVTDTSLNRATANRTVRVIDTTPPIFDPPLTTILLGHPGSSVPCLEFTPPTPTVRDNGYVASAVNVSGARVSGPGSPNCYDVGTHVYRWSATDPDNNTVTVDQTIEVQSGSIDVRYRGLEVTGVLNASPGVYYKSAVTLKFELSGGNGQYDVTVTPPPASLTNSGAVYSAVYTAEGSYPQILVQVRDQNGTGPNVGSAAYQGFGVDMTAPTIGVNLDRLPQARYVPGDASTAPFLVKGEHLEFNRVSVTDGTAGKANLGNGLTLTTGSRVQCVSVPAPNLAPLPSPACSDGKVPVGVVGAASRDLYSGYSVEMWIKPEVLGHQTLFSVPNRSSDDGASAMELFTTPDGRVCFGGYVTDARASNRCIRLTAHPATMVEGKRNLIRARQWHHIVATWDWSAGVARLYVDGRPRAFRRDDDLYTAGTGLRLCDAVMGNGGVTAMVIGAHLNADGQTASNQFVGDIGQFRLSMKVLSKEEILQNYQGGAGRPLPASAYTFAQFELEGSSTAQYGLQSVVDTNTGLCGTNETCAWSSPINAFLGSTIGSDAADPTRVSVGHPADGTSSGLVEVITMVINRDTGEEAVLSRTTTAAHGAPVAAAMRAIEGMDCRNQSGNLCTTGDLNVDVTTLAARGARGYAGRYLLRVTATDAAGNESVDEIAFNILDYVGALGKAIASLDELIPINAVTELEDARLWFQVAKSYFELSRKYEDGSFLRTAGGLQSLEDADDNGASTSSMSTYLARALHGEVQTYHDSLGSGNFLPGDAVIWNKANDSMVDAEFYDAIGMSNEQLRVREVREGYDDLAMLYPAYRSMRERMNTARGLWQSGLQSYSNNGITASNLRTSISRVIQVRGAMAETKSALQAALYFQIEGILSNAYTSQRLALEEMMDVLDKANSMDADEQGDLIAITDISVQDACLDRLSTLDLDDQLFTRCYLRLNDLARFLDGVSEPLIHTYRMRTGLGLALFNMLELSLFLSPTGVPWVISNNDFTGPGSEELILPDALAATINGAAALSTVDLSDGALARAYEKYDEAKSKLDVGDVNGAWRLFVDERCLLLRTFNRYYSTDRTILNPGDPKEAPIDPATVGCP